MVRPAIDAIVPTLNVKVVVPVAVDDALVRRPGHTTDARMAQPNPRRQETQVHVPSYLNRMATRPTPGDVPLGSAFPATPTNVPRYDDG